MNQELERKTFKVINDEGKEIECEVLFEFTSEETEKSYIVYTDHSKDEAGNIQIFANVFDPEKEQGKLEPIETEREWKIIETVLEEIKTTVMQNANPNNESEENNQ
jgi:uncharacterized protein YrzB (UPF0473 family)